MDTATKNILREVGIFAKTYIWLSPLNIKEEKRKFLNSRQYNPQLIYPEIPLNKIAVYKNLLKKVPQINGENLRNTFYSNRLKETKLRLQLLSSIGNAKRVTVTSQKLYGLTFSKIYLRKAQNDAVLPLLFGKQKNLDASKTVRLIKKYLLKLGIRGWNVRITRHRDFYTQVKASKHQILISKYINWDFTTLESMLAHEIDGHVVRAVNAEKQKGIFRKRFPFYIKTEEGLASYLGDYHSLGGELSLKHHAIKYLGGFVALNNSFRETYNFFLDNGFTKSLAFQRTLRLKRGLTDTKEPGCNAREAMYYEGMLEVKKYIKKGGSINKLFAGKVGLKDIPKLSEQPNILIPKRII